MLRLVIYKKNACVYLVGGTKTPIVKFDKNAEIFEILNELNYKISPYFWNTYEGFFNKGKFYKAKTALRTACLFKKLIRGELKWKNVN